MEQKRIEQFEVAIDQQVQLAHDTYRVRFTAPGLARRIVPGQFVMVRPAEGTDPLLGRALALYDVILQAGEPRQIDLVYLVQGKMTNRLSRMLPDQRLSVWGPLGNGFAVRPTDHLVMVAGGIGQTPFLSVAKEYLHRQQYGSPSRQQPRARRVTLLYGARTARLLAGIDDFERIGVEVQVSTDDGSRGYHGRVTELLEAFLNAKSPEECRIVCCGPEPMMEGVSSVASRFGVPCQVSLETPMACGLGICFTCVARIRQDDGPEWDYRRTCVEGPVFDARDVVW